ncbi:MAG: protein kinase [Rhodothermales bacterium]
MDFSNIDRVEELFHRVKGLDDSERARVLRNFPDLKDEVESLVRAHNAATEIGFLDHDSTGMQERVTKPQEDPHSLIGRQVGPYRFERYLGGGGMGDVYLAVRQTPFKFLVALKILRKGLRTDEVLRRFDAERQILASLNHPNIAKLLDGGITDDGLPYFAMEYVEGLPLVAYAERNRLSIAERLALFGEVCNAVAYAHRNLIIHRDLKPQNILVTRDGTVKLLDFGIAKIINPNLADLSTPITQTRYRMLTPDHASPEQVRGEPLATTTDVYSLGVLLYELLTGVRPYVLASRTAAEIENLICEVDPPLPSRQTVASRSALTENQTDASPPLPSGSSERTVRRLRGDLDNICMMALRKEAGRRYQSVEQLAADLERHLNGLPVLASRDSPLYRGLKFARRHAVPVWAGSLIVAMIIGFAAYSSVQARKLVGERNHARLEADKAAQVSSFVVDLFRMADPESAAGDTITVRSILDDGAARADKELADQPVLHADLLGVIASAYSNLGKYDRAMALLEQSVAIRRKLGDVDDSFLADLANLASFYAINSRAKESVRVFDEYIGYLSERLGPDHPEVLMTEMRRLGTAHVVKSAAVSDSILTLWTQLEPRVGELADADAAIVYGDVADLYYTKRMFPEAEQAVVNAVRITERLEDTKPSDLGMLYNRMAWVYLEAEEPQQAYDAASRAVQIHDRIFPDGHRNRATSYGIQGEALSQLGRHDEGEMLLLKDLAMRRQVFGDLHPTIGRTLRYLGRVQERKAAYEKALDYYRQSTDIFRRMFGSDYLITRQYELSEVGALVGLRRYDEAESLMLSTYRLFADTRGEADNNAVEVARRLAEFYQARGNVHEAAQFAVLANAGVAPVQSVAD